MNFKRFGRTANLFDKANLEGGIYLASNGNKYGSITDGVRSGVKINVLPNTQYTLSLYSNMNISIRILQWSGETYITHTSKYNVSGNVSLTITTNSTTDKIAFNVEGVNGQYAENLMLNEGSTALPYQPYMDWTNTSHYIMRTATDTITTLPADIYANDTTATVGLKGNMEQNGTPSPQNPIQPQECGNMSSNLFDLTAYYAKDSGVSNIVTTQNSITYNVSSTYCTIRYKFSIAQNETMKLSLGSATGNGRLEIRYYNTQAKQQVGDTLTVTQNERITLTGSSEYDSVSIYISNGPTIGTMSFSDIMINIGTTFLPFEPYGQYKIPILSNNTATPVYLGEVESTRKICKLVLTGEELFTINASGNNTYFALNLINPAIRTQAEICTHLTHATIGASNTVVGFSIIANGAELRIRIPNAASTSLADFETYLATQYAAGTPVTVWYVLTTETTGIVNEPIRKIGDYADTVSGITIPTIAGANSFDVLTTLKPSEVTVNYKGWHPVSSVHERENGAWT